MNEIRDWCWLPHCPTRWGRVWLGGAASVAECGNMPWVLHTLHTLHHTRPHPELLSTGEHTELPPHQTHRTLLLTHCTGTGKWKQRNIIFFNKLQHGWCVVRLGLLLLVANSAKLISIWMKENIYFLWRRQYFHHLLFPHFYVEVQWKSSLISSGQWSLCWKRE